MPPERRVGDDYLLTTDDSVTLCPYEPERDHIEGHSWFATAVAAKSAKSYASVEKPNLLVYANFSASKLAAHMLRGAMPTISSGTRSPRKITI